jgi:hypothetical protein
VARVIHEAGVNEIHVRPTRRRDSQMRFRRESITLGKPYVPDEYARVLTPSELVRAVVAAASAGMAPVTTDAIPE